MRIYISIPMTGHDLATQYTKATEIAEQIKALGHEPVNPFDTPEPPEELSEKQRYAYFMGEDIKRLLNCDSIIFCDGWEQSCGCNIEHDVAMRFKAHRCDNLQCYYRIEDIPKLARC